MQLAFVECNAERAETFASDVLGKQVIRSADRSGFVVNALLVPYLLSAIRMVESGFATKEDIDKSIVLGLAHPMGPLALAVWNESLGRRGFASPVGGPRWFSPQPGFFEARGFRDPELSPVGSLFNWTEGTESLLRFPRIDRRQEAEVTLRVQGGAGSTAAGRRGCRRGCARTATASG